MVLKRIACYFLLTGLALVFAACAGIVPAETITRTPAAAQPAQGTTIISSTTDSATTSQNSLSGTASIIPTLTPTEMSASYTPSLATKQVSGLPDGWSTYFSDIQPAFSFEYPSLYDSEAYSACKIRQESSADYLLYLRFGFRSELAVASNDLHSLNLYVERWKQGLDIESEESQTINGLQGISIDYRFGGTNRFGSVTFIGQDDLVYIFNFSAGGTCDLAEINLDELAIYTHAVETFRLEAINP